MTGTNSALEHACHLWHASQDFDRVLWTELPHEGTVGQDQIQAPGFDRSNEQDPWIVAKGLEEATTSITTRLQGLSSRQWQHEIPWGPRLHTIESHVNQLLHQMVHRQHLVILSVLDMADS